MRPWVDAETVTWLAVSDAADPQGDVLTLSVRARDATSGSELRAGRLLVSMGAVRPLHLDGARGALRISEGTSVEVFGGVPVVRRFDYRTFDWAAGGRLGQAVGDSLSVGASYQQRRIDGARADEEAGADVAFTPSSSITAAGRWAFDLVGRGTTDALGSVSVQDATKRAEIFTTHRSPGRLLPSTSLFSVLGDFAATSVGTTLRARLFPRLEAIASGSGQTQGSDLGAQGLLRTTLAFDDAFEGSLGLEARRVSLGESRWTGARATVTVPLGTRWRTVTEVELVVPDAPKGRGAAWPWAFVAAHYRPASSWDVAAGVEGSSGPESRGALAGLARVSYAFDGGGR